MWYLLLVAALVAGFLLIPLGLPGIWLMIAAAVGYKLFAQPVGLSWTVLGVAIALAALAELLEFWLSLRYTRRYGGSPRAGWWALIGGLVGAVLGVPVPIVGSVIGAFLGSFLGALVGEYSVTRHAETAQRAAWGSLVGRVVATAVKTGLGLAIGVLVLVRAW